MVDREDASQRRLSGAILAAGHGERLRAAAGGIPKPLVELYGEPLLVRQVRTMLSLGLRPVHVIVNSESARMMEERNIKFAAEVDLCVRDTANSMESLLTLGERIRSGTFALATVDAVGNRETFQHFFAKARGSMALNGPKRFDGILAVTEWRGDKHPLFVKVTADGRIAALGEPASALATAGLYVFSTRIFEYASEVRDLRLDALRQFLAFMLDKGMSFAAIGVNGVIDIDEGIDLEAARTLVRA